MCKTIKQKVKFRLTPQQVYSLLADSKLHSKLTGQKALISENIGGRFSTHAGRVSGINVDLLPGKRIVQAWRSEEFPEGIFSMVTFHLTQAKNGGTQLVLTHRGVPKNLIPNVEKEWKILYWDKIREIAFRHDLQNN